MKTLLCIILSLVVLLGISAVKGFAAAEKYGEAITIKQIIPIKDILTNPKAYEGKRVVIEGKIETECPTGCWFYVKVQDSDASIYVDIGRSGFAIPQYKGKKILVEGIVLVEKLGIMIDGKGVEVR